MRSTKFTTWAIRLAASIVGFTALVANAQTYPTKPVTMIALFSPGSAGDVIARAVARGISEGGGGINMVVENKDGASGHIAVLHILGSAPDGYTLMMGATSVVINMFTQKVNYTMASFSPVAMVGTIANSLVVPSSIEVKSMAELVTLAKAKPGQFMMATGGPTGPGTFLSETFKTAAAVDMGLIPYKGSSLAIPDLLAGRIHAIFGPTATGIPLVNTGRARILGVTGAKRLAVLPQVPTFTESGYPMLDIPSWFAVMGPAGVPAPIVARLNSEVLKALARKDVQEQLVKLGVDVTPGSAENLNVFLKDAVVKWDGATKGSSFRVK